MDTRRPRAEEATSRPSSWSNTPTPRRAHPLREGGNISPQRPPRLATGNCSSSAPAEATGQALSVSAARGTPSSHAPPSSLAIEYSCSKICMGTRIPVPHPGVWSGVAASKSFADTGCLRSGGLCFLCTIPMRFAHRAKKCGRSGGDTPCPRTTATSPLASSSKPYAEPLSLACTLSIANSACRGNPRDWRIPSHG